MCCHNQTSHLGLEFETSVADSSFTFVWFSKHVSPVGISETGKAALLVGSPILVRAEPKGEDAAAVPTGTWKTDRLKLQN